jgi:putative membrane protein
MTYKTFIVGIAIAVAAASSAAAQGAGGDQAFVTKIAGVRMGEVELGTLALDKFSSRDVKGFAERMIAEHRKSGEELKAIATRKNLEWPAGPSADAKALKDRLSKLSGAAFDRAYIDAMVTGHREVLEVMKTEAQSGADAELKGFASKAASTVQAHLTHALDVQKEVGKTATN